MTFHQHHMIEYEKFSRALNNAVFWQNRCCELEEIIELFCLDAEAHGDALEKAEGSAKHFHDLFHFKAEESNKIIAVLKAKLALVRNQTPIGYVGIKKGEYAYLPKLEISELPKEGFKAVYLNELDTT